MNINDGLWRYRWTSRFGRHSVFFHVVDGRIQTSPARLGSPVDRYESQLFSRFVMDRMAPQWQHDDDTLQQVTCARRDT